MALTIAAYPISVLPTSEPQMSLDTAGTFPSISYGFEPLMTIKSEPDLDENMETSYLNTTYTELSSVTANFLQLKQGQTDMYQDRLSEGDSMGSWTYLHPENWGPKEVLDWVYSIAETHNFDGAIFRGEAYQSLSGKQLCAMNLADFLTVDQSYGKMVFQIFRCLLDGANNFKKPSPPEMFQAETLGNVPYFDFLDSPADSRPPCSTASMSPAAKDKHLSVVREHNEIKVNLDGFLYDIDLPVCSQPVFQQIDDSDYSSGSEGELDRSQSVSSEVFGLLTDDEESADLDLPEFCRKSQTSSVSSDSGSEADGDKKSASRTRRPASTSKGNHLWEFVRDLLKDARFNPSLLKWEDKEEGVFKFVQSEAVAQMWGRKKNNPGMTYEKLSRAMRFCRSAGYFDSVPKTGRFPKKLCFKFGKKASGWRD